MAQYQSPEDLDKLAAELVEKHKKGELPDEAYAEELEPDLPPKEEPAADDKTPEEIAAEEAATKKEEEEAAAKAKEDEGKTDEELAEEAAKAAEAATDPVDKRVLDAQKKMHESTGKAARLAKMVDDTQSENDALREQMKSGKPTVGPAPKVSLTQERVEKLQAEYPDLKEFWQDMRDTQIENVRLREHIDSTFKDIKQDRGSDKFMSEIKEIHADAEKIQMSDEWTGWLETQPSYIRRAIYEAATAKETADIITMYKRDTGRPVPGEKPKSTAVVDVDGDPSADPEKDPAAPSTEEEKLEQARKASSPTLSKPARQHRPGGGKPKTYSRAEIHKISNDPKKIEWLISEPGEKWQAEVQKAMIEGRLTE